MAGAVMPMSQGDYFELSRRVAYRNLMGQPLADIEEVIAEHEAFDEWLANMPRLRRGLYTALRTLFEGARKTLSRIQGRTTGS
jgi:hypothetical protein